MTRSLPMLFLLACGGSADPASNGPTEPTTAPTTPPSTPPTGDWGRFEADFEADLQGALEQAWADSGAPGMAMAVADPTGHRMWVSTIGQAEVATNRAWEPDTPFPIGSVTKTFTTSLILQLVEDGVVGLDDPLDDWLTHPWAGQGVSIRHLLQHTSGIASYNYVGGFDKTGVYTSQELVDWAAMVEPDLRFAPGSQFEYTNTGYVLLGMVAEAASGESVSAGFDGRFFGPLGLDQSWYAAENPAEMVHGYEGDPLQDVTAGQHPSGADAAGAIISTPADTAAWGAALFSGQVLGPGSLDLMTTPLLIDQAEVGYGLGLFGNNDPEWGGSWGHTGGYSGQLSYMYFMERPDRVVVVMVNRVEADLVEASNLPWFEILGIGP